jgi:hypothetical protein
MWEHRFRIVVEGKLGEAALEAFDGMEIQFADGQTSMVADLDQASLYGVLQRINALALELVSVTRED